MNLKSEKQLNEKSVIKFRRSIRFIELQIQIRCESDLLYNLLKLNLKNRQPWKFHMKKSYRWELWKLFFFVPSSSVGEMMSIS